MVKDLPLWEQTLNNGRFASSLGEAVADFGIWKIVGSSLLSGLSVIGGAADVALLSRQFEANPATEAIAAEAVEGEAQILAVADPLADRPLAR